MKQEYFALITGASEGFGKALALECAARNMNVALVALKSSGLPELCYYIERNFGVKTLCIEADLTETDACKKLKAEISKYHISINILINNAGIGGTTPFEMKDEEFYFKQIQLNTIVPTQLTLLFLNELARHPQSHILNVSSLACYFSVPGKQVYGGTKSYLTSFSRSLRRELIRKKIFVSTVCPGGMNTLPQLVLQNWNTKGLARWSIMNPEDVASVTISKMLEGREIIIPGMVNRFFIALNKIVPPFIKDYLLNRFPSAPDLQYGY